MKYLLKSSNKPPHTISLELAALLANKYNFTPIEIEHVIAAFEEAKLKANQSFYVGYVGMVGENTEVILGKTKEAVTKQMRDKLELICELDTAVENMDNDDLAEFASKAGVKVGDVGAVGY